MKHTFTLLLIILAGQLLTNNSHAQSARVYELPAGLSAKDFLAGHVIFKIKPAYRDACLQQQINITGVEDILNEIPNASLKKSFSHIEKPVREKNEYGQTYADLSLLYEIKFDSNQSVRDIVNLLLANEEVDYAEPRFVYEIQYSPNDPKLYQQYFIDIIKAKDAWDINKGDSTVVIGILDTGTSLTHPDLQDKLAVNIQDPIDGIDNDGDGYVDNYRGWDFGGSYYGSGGDNDPTYSGVDHGVLVAGVAAAATDNGYRVSSVGFRTKYVPIKVCVDGQSSVPYGYEGIVYGADLGIPILNMSWGGTGFSQYGKDVCDYAAINKGCLLIAAGGNTIGQLAYYPASYESVLSVAGSQGQDQIWQSTTTFGTSYHYFVDISAPARSIRTTASHNMEYAATGTSMAAPIVAGVAALVKAQFPNYNNLQVGQRVRVTADQSYYTINSDARYKDKLGLGRVNAFEAMTMVTPAIRINTLKVQDQNNFIPEGYDTVDVYAKLINYCDPTVHLQVTLSTPDSHLIEILDNQAYAGEINTLQVGDHPNPFRFVVKQPVSYTTKIWLKFSFEDGNYHDYQYVQFEIQPTSIEIDVNNLHTWISDNGNFGYANYNSPRLGEGLMWKNNPNALFEGGFMFGNSSSAISDRLRRSFFYADDDLRTEGSYKIYHGHPQADFIVDLNYNDNPMGAVSNNVSINQRLYAYANMPYDDFLIMEYRMMNKGSSDLNNMYAGLFTEWGLDSPYENSAFDSATNMVYVWSIGMKHPEMFGLVMLNNGTANTTAFHPFSFGFSGAEKLDALKGNVGNISQTNTDIISTISAGPFTITAGNEETVAFAIVAGDDLASLKLQANLAKEKYNCQIHGNLPVVDLGPDQTLCPGDSIQLGLSAAYASVEWSTGDSTNGIKVNSSGIYSVVVKDQNGCQRFDEVSIADHPDLNPNFQTLYEVCGSKTVELDAGTAFQSWSWSTGHKNHSIEVNTPGAIQFTAQDANGCNYESSMTIVQHPLPEPELGDDQSACFPIMLSAGNGSDQYQWSTGDSLPLIKADESGFYKVFVTNSFGCVAKDSMYFELLPQPLISLQPQVETCDIAVLDAGHSGDAYLWSTGETSQSISVDKSGIYQVQVVNEEGCIGFSTTKVVVPKMVADFILDLN